MISLCLLSAASYLLIMRARKKSKKTFDPGHNKARIAPSYNSWSKPVTYDFCKSIPKIELHAHIGGSIRNSTLVELIANSNNQQNYPELQVLKGDQRSLSQCFQLFDAVHDLVSSIAILKRITKECIQDFAMENCIYLELRTTPRHDIPNVTAQQYVNAVVETIRACQLEEITENITVRLLLSISRAQDPTIALQTVDLAGQSDRNIVVGLDFSGNPSKGDVNTFLPAFQRARDMYKLPITFHIGEINDPVEVEVLLNNTTKKDRLGHGLFLTAEQTQRLLDQQICIEICPTSNVRTLELTSLDQHPTLSTWLQAEEYPICISTDDRGVFKTTLSNEYYMVAQAFQLTRADIVRMARMAVHHVFDRKMKSHVEKQATELLQKVLHDSENDKNNSLKRNESLNYVNVKRNDIIVIGITGASCSGKSTLTKAFLQRHNEQQFLQTRINKDTTSSSSSSIPSSCPSSCPMHVIHCDTFRAYTLFGYRHTDDSGKREWEHPSNGAWNAIQVELQKSIATLPSGSIVLVDGHMILEDERIRNALDLCVYMNITEEECRNRRMKRRMPAPHGWNKNKYFDTHIWNVHVERHQAAMNYFTGMQQKNCLLTLDGTQKIDVLVDQIFDLVKAKRKKVSSKL